MMDYVGLCQINLYAHSGVIKNTLNQPGSFCISYLMSERSFSKKNLPGDPQGHTESLPGSSKSPCIVPFQN
jgi:hypothetical protein